MRRKNTKRFMSMVSVTGLLFSICSLYASAMNPVSTSLDTWYVEQGQIDLQELSFEIEEGTVSVNLKQLSSAAQQNQTLIMEAIKASPLLRADIQNQIRENREPVCVGYTRVYLKEVADSDGVIHCEPLTNREVLNSVSPYDTGEPSSHYQLTLWTVASTTTRSSTRTLEAYSYAEWGFQWLGGNDVNANGVGYDFISTSLSSCDYVLSVSSMAHFDENGALLSDASLNYYKAYDGDKSITYGIAAMNSRKYRERVAGHISSSTAKRTIKISTQYLHTWAQMNPSISYNTNGTVTFGGSNTSKSWELASSVTITA